MNASRCCRERRERISRSVADGGRDFRYVKKEESVCQLTYRLTTLQDEIGGGD